MIPGIPGLDKGPPDPTSTCLPTPFVKAFHKLLEFSQKLPTISQKVAQKLPFVTKVAPPKVVSKEIVALFLYLV